MRATHSEEPGAAAAPRSKFSMPFDLPGATLNRHSVGLFNALYRSRASSRWKRSRESYGKYLFPLDGIGHWNRMYGTPGFLQHQSVVPRADAAPKLPRCSRRSARIRETPRSSACSRCSAITQPAGLMSFARPGVTLALDIPIRGAGTLALLERLDAIVRDAGGAIYPAKDARMSPETFRASFPAPRGIPRARRSAVLVELLAARLAMTIERIVIFGATSAIAQATARRLAARGARLHLVARDPAKLEAVRADLAARGSPAVTTSLADLDDVERHRALIDEAEGALAPIDAAIIAQGTLPDQRACESDFALAASAMHTNFIAPAALAAELANRFEVKGSGTIVAISSVAGDRGRASNYVYGAAKGALSIFLQGLRARLHDKGVRVVTVKPGFVDTPMTASFAKGVLWSSPERIAAGIVKAMERGTPEVYLPWFWRPIMFVLRHLPESIFVRLKI